MADSPNLPKHRISASGFDASPQPVLVERSMMRSHAAKAVESGRLTIAACDTASQIASERAGQFAADVGAKKERLT